MNPDLDKLTKRPVQYWFEDGLGELVIAGMFVLIGLSFLLQALASSPFVAGLAGLFAILAVGLGPWLGRTLITRVKERVIYPRTGYVKYPAFPRSRRLVSALAALVVSAGLVALANLFAETLNWLPLIEGVAVAILLYFQAVQIGFLRLYFESLASVLFGAGIAIFGWGDFLGSGSYFLAFGLLLAIIGGSTFARYLILNPVSPKKEQFDE